VSPDPSEKRKMAPAEWVTFSIALVILLGVIGAIVVHVPGSKEPASPRAAIGAVVERDGRFVVPVEIENTGEETAESVQVSATFTMDGDEQTADQVVDFLAGGEVAEVEFLFGEDPADGELEVEVTGFSVP
jgi:uncharacterized protein (TIGR02588 family)